MDLSSDPIQVEIIGHRFRAATEEMMATLVKTAYSPNIKERRDCSVAIFDRKGRLISLTAITAGHLSSLMGMVANLLERYPINELRPGDVYLTNDPYVGGGAHLMDLTVTRPVFVDGKVVAFVASLAHHSDIGGKVAGSESADCTSIFQEGLRIPPVKLVDQGALCRDIMDLVMLNSRIPFERDGDLTAQIATSAIGTRRVEEIYIRFGGEVVDQSIEELLDHAERRTRSEISKIPDGTYGHEDFLDNDGVRDVLVKLKVAITVKGDQITFDFSGSDPQVSGARNMAYVSLLSCVYYAVKAITDPLLPPNAGYFRAIEVKAPKGSVVNCSPPAATSDRSATANIMGDVIMGAFAKVVPERVMAGCGPLHGLIFSGVDPRKKRYFVDYETFAGATGGYFDADGKDAVRVHTSGAANLPAESLEQEFPLTILRYELLQNSGGPGRFRGGLSTRRDVEIGGVTPRLAGRGLRQTRAAAGMFGGESGKTGRFVLNPASAEPVVLPGAFSELDVTPGWVIRVETPSGAGYGDPLEREAARVLADVIAGKVSGAAAESDYGVVLSNMTVDEAATEKLRTKKREGRTA